MRDLRDHGGIHPEWNNTIQVWIRPKNRLLAVRPTLATDTVNVTNSYFDLNDDIPSLNEVIGGCDFAQLQLQKNEELCGKKKVRIFVRYRQELYHLYEKDERESYPYMAIICQGNTTAELIKRLLEEVGFKKARIYSKDKMESFRNGEVNIVIINKTEVSHEDVGDLKVTDAIYWDQEDYRSFTPWETMKKEITLATKDEYQLVYDEDVSVERMDNLIWNQKQVTVDILNNWNNHKITIPEDILRIISDSKGEEYYHHDLILITPSLFRVPARILIDNKK